MLVRVPAHTSSGRARAEPNPFERTSSITCMAKIDFSVVTPATQTCVDRAALSAPCSSHPAPSRPAAPPHPTLSLVLGTEDAKVHILDERGTGVAVTVAMPSVPVLLATMGTVGTNEYRIACAGRDGVVRFIKVRCWRRCHVQCPRPSPATLDPPLERQASHPSTRNERPVLQPGVPPIRQLRPCRLHGLQAALLLDQGTSHPPTLAALPHTHLMPSLSFCVRHRELADSS